MSELLRIFFFPMIVNKVRFTRGDWFGRILYDNPECWEYWVESLPNLISVYRHLHIHLFFRQTLSPVLCQVLWSVSGVPRQVSMVFVLEADSLSRAVL